ncbi:MAG: DNA polymerase III subunit gamma/tau [Bacteroidales bacterium]
MEKPTRDSGTFIVSARKYRPGTFDLVIGQDHIIKTLKNALRNQQLAQAFLFTGPRGVGKTTTARLLAKVINCDNITADFEPCNECPSCIAFNNNASLNVFELDAASNNSVDDIRNLIDKIRVMPQQGKYKVYIIDEVHMLSTSAFNAFLKTLEEPPSYVKFILATTEKHKIMPTILSRCQVYDFKRISIQDIVRQLKYVAQHEGIETEEEALHVIAEKADGALRDALSIFDQLATYAGGNLTYARVAESLNVLSYEDYFKLTNLLLAGNMFESVLLLDEVIARGFDGQAFINGLAIHFRTLWMCKNPGTERLIEASEQVKELYRQQAARAPLAFLVLALDLMNQCDINYRNSNNRRMLVELTLIKICQLIRNPGNEETVARPQATTQATESAPAYKKPATPSTTPPPPTSTDTQPSRQAPQTNTPASSMQSNGGRSAFGLKTGNIKNLGKTSTESSESNNSKTSESADNEKDEEAEPANIFFDEESLKRAWRLFLEHLSAEDKNLALALNLANIRKVDDSTIEFEVIHSLMEKDLFDNRPRILSFLRDQLGTGRLSMNIVIKEEEVTVKAFTPKEKLQQIVQSWPEVAAFIERLKLEVNL